MDLFSRLFERLTMYIPVNMGSEMPSGLQSWIASGFPKISLDAAGLVALADLTTVAYRTALTGTSALADVLILSPGLHKQQDAPDLNQGEYPACAAMTTDYVFRIENQATVLYLQKVGRTGQLTSVSVHNTAAQQSGWSRMLCTIFDYPNTSPLATMAYITAVLLTLTVVVLLVLLRDWWGFTVVAILMLARFINVLVIRTRAELGWKGEPEPGQKSDLIILMSNDRWIRMRGDVDDVKAITSGEWLREPKFFESSLVAFATLIVYLDAALAANATKEGKLLLLILLFCSVGLLGLTNEYTKVLKMYGRTIHVDGPRERYKRRRDLTDKLIKDTGRYQWALRLGMSTLNDIERLKEDGVIRDDFDGLSGNTMTSMDDQVIL